MMSDIVSIFRDTDVRKIRYRLCEVEEQLSPLHQIYSTVAQDCRVDNDWLKNKMMELGLDTVDELVYELANRNVNMKIWCRADRTVDSYSLNFLWINASVQDEGTDEYIFSADILEEFRESMTEWRRINPRAVIYLWYDSTLVTDRAYSNTKSLCTKLGIEMRDVRSIADISECIEQSLSSAVPVYYRVDILKVLIAQNTYSDQGKKCRYVIVSDLDVAPVTEEQLFDLITVKWLDSYGYVFTNNGCGLFENSFFMLDAENDKVKTVHKQYMIDSVETDLRDMCWYNGQSVFEKYWDFRCSMGESELSDRPRKPVAVPLSRFTLIDSDDTEPEVEFQIMIDGEKYRVHTRVCEIQLYD